MSDEQRRESPQPEVVRFDLDERTVTFRYETEGDVREVVRLATAKDQVKP